VRTSGTPTCRGDGKNQKRVRQLRRHLLYQHGGPLLAWSPDSKTLAFSSDLDPSGAFYVYTLPVKENADPTRIDSSKSAWPQQIMWRPR
jgi:Tol biopolymer transport system component